ncbi:hypothetical protein NDU88_007018 [Pleurodeles waltl]|uniref:Uncharacterized protein n=1 Tax=Pleurodeles waltl TaxID=8319 RepID=A0AAV7N0X8_PLEWA|nr:hypothetical protein NDU88_007018 [Pleurodeles waltl]
MVTFQAYKRVQEAGKRAHYLVLWEQAKSKAGNQLYVSTGLTRPPLPLTWCPGDTGVIQKSPQGASGREDPASTTERADGRRHGADDRGESGSKGACEGTGRTEEQGQRGVMQDAQGEIDEGEGNQEGDRYRTRRRKKEPGPTMREGSTTGRPSHIP